MYGELKVEPWLIQVQMAQLADSSEDGIDIRTKPIIAELIGPLK